MRMPHYKPREDSRATQPEPLRAAGVRLPGEREPRPPLGLVLAIVAGVAVPLAWMVAFAWSVSPWAAVGLVGGLGALLGVLRAVKARRRRRGHLALEARRGDRAI
jgi:hypothetical protein